jgi:hypothetical protein
MPQKPLDVRTVLVIVASAGAIPCRFSLGASTQRDYPSDDRAVRMEALASLRPSPRNTSRVRCDGFASDVVRQHLKPRAAATEACACPKLDSDVMLVQSGQDRHPKNATDRLDGSR